MAAKSLHRPRRLPVWPVPRFDDSPKGENHYHVIVIGAGIGGLSAAALLAARGYKVLVIEAHYLPGGNCTSWQRGVSINGKKHSFVFDSGVQDISGLGPKGPLRNLLNRLDAAQRIEWSRVRHLYWKDGLCLDGAVTPGEFVDNLCRSFAEEAGGIKKFFSEMEAVYREIYAGVEDTGGVPMPPTPSQLIAWPEKHPHASRWMNAPFDDMLDVFFKDDKIKQMLRILSEYITDTPGNLLAGDMAPLFGYYFDGGYYPIGGSQRIADLLAKIVREKGGKIILRNRAEKILIEDRHVAGVRTAGNESYFAPLVIANGDVVSTLTELVDPAILPEDYAKKIARLSRGPSAILMSIGLSTLMPLPARIFIRQNGLEFGVGNPSVLDPSLAPKGFSAVTILCLLSERDAAPWHQRDETYLKRKEAFAERLIGAVADSVFPAIRSHIVYREIASPATFATFTKAKNGNIYGAARGAWRPGLRSPIPGLLLAGAGTETGAGIEAVVVSGMRAANLISEARMPAKSF